jgi:hypothetical protein
LSHGCVESNQIRKKGEKIFLLFTLSLEKWKGIVLATYTATPYS